MAQLPDRLDDIDAAYNALNDAANLVAALQALCFDISQMKPDERIGAQLRDALVGLGDALEAVLRVRP